MCSLKAITGSTASTMTPVTDLSPDVQMKQNWNGMEIENKKSGIMNRKVEENYGFRILVVL